MTTALFIGRFQPLHNGHVRAIEKIMKSSGKLVIGIGSAQKQNEAKNPFSFEERKKMIELSVSGNYKVLPLEDMDDNNLWIKQVERVCEDFDIVYSGNPLVQELLSGASHLVKPTEIFPCASATEIRVMMAAGNPDWKKFVPKPVAKFIEEINGIERVKRILNRK